MKKFITFISIILILSLCSCNNNTKEYKLIEITGVDLLNNLNNGDKKFILATYSTAKDSNEEFLNSLKQAAQNIQTNIYYMDIKHVDSSSMFNIIEFIGIDYTTNSYVVFDKGSITKSFTYSSYQQMYQDLRSSRSEDELELQSNEDMQKTLTEAKKDYEEGNIGYAFDKLGTCWTLDEAKEFFQNNQYLNLINNWETYEYTDMKNSKIAYHSITFINGANYYLGITKEGEVSNFTKPDNIMDYDTVYFKLKDDIIYTSKSDNGTYKKKYEVKNIDKLHFNVKDLENNKEYNFIRGD